MGNKPCFKNLISSGYVAGLKVVIQSHISEAFSAIIQQEMLLILSMQGWDFKYHLEPTSSKVFSVQFSPSFVSDSLWPHGLQHVRLPRPSPIPRVCSNSCPSSWWCHPNISSSVIPFSSCLQSFPASGSFQMSQFFTLSGQSIGVSASASVLPMNIKEWFPLGWTGWISLQSKGLPRVFSSTTVQKHQFLCAQLSFWSNSYITTWLLEKL